MREHCSVRHTLTSCLSSFVSASLPHCAFYPQQGALLVLIPMPCPLTPCQFPAPWRCCLCQAYLVFILYVSPGMARIGTSRRRFPNQPPPPPPLLLNPPLPYPSLSPALLLSLCLNGRKVLWVGNGLHQTLRGVREREGERQSYRDTEGV